MLKHQWWEPEKQWHTLAEWVTLEPSTPGLPSTSKIVVDLGACFVDGWRDSTGKNGATIRRSHNAVFDYAEGLLKEAGGDGNSHKDFLKEVRLLCQTKKVWENYPVLFKDPWPGARKDKESSATEKLSSEIKPCTTCGGCSAAVHGEHKCCNHDDLSDGYLKFTADPRWFRPGSLFHGLECRLCKKQHGNEDGQIKPSVNIEILACKAWSQKHCNCAAIVCHECEAKHLESAGRSRRRAASRGT